MSQLTTRIVQLVQRLATLLAGCLRICQQLLTKMYFLFCSQRHRNRSGSELQDSNNHGFTAYQCCNGSHCCKLWRATQRQCCLVVGTMLGGGGHMFGSICRQPDIVLLRPAVQQHYVFLLLCNTPLLHYQLQLNHLCTCSREHHMPHHTFQAWT